MIKESIRKGKESEQKYSEQRKRRIKMGMIEKNCTAIIMRNEEKKAETKIEDKRKTEEKNEEEKK